MQPHPQGLWSHSLQAGPLQGRVDHLTIRLRRTEQQRLSDAGSQAASGNQVLQWNGVPRGPALSNVVGVETKWVTWVKDRHTEGPSDTALEDTGTCTRRRQESA